jgi:hypothetical protein
MFPWVMTHRTTKVKLLQPYSIVAADVLPEIGAANA